MFERRLKMMLAVVLVLAVVMSVRAFQLQVLEKGRWTDRANDSMKRAEILDAPRGQIFDANHTLIAFDAACIDAAVQYQAIAMDPEWIKAQAKARLKARNEPTPAGMTAVQVRVEEEARVRADIDAMWEMIAEVTGRTAEEIENTRQEILRRVVLRRRQSWYARYAKAQARKQQLGEAGESSPWIRWLVDAKQEDPTQQRDAALDAAAIVVSDQLQPHVIVADLTNDQQIELRKRLDRCPGLVLKESTHRRYDPLAATAFAHALGRITAVQKEDLEHDPLLGTDNLRRYFPGDSIGRGGLESLAEPFLRGTKGQILRMVGRADPLESTPAKPGQDVTVTLDLALQADVLKIFHEVSTVEDRATVMRHDLHGAAVVIDVATNKVRVLASYPTYDANQFEAKYNAWATDDVNRPLMNRATMAQVEPGSTVKTIIGSYGVTTGVVSATEGIECTGYLVIPDARTGKPVRLGSSNRCWIASMFAHDSRVGSVAHHQVPIPHQGRYGNPDGFLSFADALERSCNVYFETVADRLHMDGVHNALSLFGLGSRTGIGIPEVTGRIPPARPLPPGQRFDNILDRKQAWLAGIGQGPVAATPIQMANVAATLARGGIWMRPRLLNDEPVKGEDVKDLHLDPHAVAALREGMFKVVNSDAGTGVEPKALLYKYGLEVAGKTGSAQASKLSVPIRDAAGKEKREPDENGVPDKGPKLWLPVEPNQPDMDWYQGTGQAKDRLAHAWFIGYAPAANPKVAFCVFVEYGGSGGHVAGAVARDVLEACIKHGYLEATKHDLVRSDP